jgi:hypothetical protein
MSDSSSTISIRTVFDICNDIDLFFDRKRILSGEEGSGGATILQKVGLTSTPLGKMLVCFTPLWQVSTAFTQCLS